MTTSKRITEHPAQWSANVLVTLAGVVEREARRIGQPLAVLDPFAGVGRWRLDEALGLAVNTVDGVELQPEWCDEFTMQGDAAHLPAKMADSYAAVITSACYGNRVADHHDAKDPCKSCGGRGIVWDSPKKEVDRPCGVCKGSGLSWRNTYAHALRRNGGELVPGSAAAMPWGRDYRFFHRDAINEMLRVVVPGGLLAINMSNHYRTLVKGHPPVEQQVVEWWINRLIVSGCFLRAVLPVDTPRNRNGANAHPKKGDDGTTEGPDPRVENEVVIVAHTPNPRRPQ